MRAVLKYFIDNPLLVKLLLVLIIVMGVLAFPSLKRNAFPDLDFKVLYVTTLYPGAAPRDVEVNVTVPLEEELLKVSGIKELNSYSTENVSSIIIVLDQNARNPDKIKSDIGKAVDRVGKLPREVRGKPTVTELGLGAFPVFEVAVSGNIPELELRKYALTLEKKLKTVAGVGSTQKLGYRKREVRVELDLDKAAGSYVSLFETMAAISGTNVRLTGGAIQSLATRRNVVTMAQFTDPQAVGDVIVRSAFSGRRVVVSDIAAVRDDFEKQELIVRANKVPAINITINKKSDADAVSTAEKVRRVVDDYNRQLPAGIKAEVVRDLSVYVKAGLGDLFNNAVLGFLLVAVMLILLLDFWPALYTALVIPASLLATFFFMYATDIRITNPSLLAIIIVLGQLVDNGIVISELIYQLREKGKSGAEAALEGTLAIFWPVFATYTTTVASFLPILLMGGVFADWLRPIPILVTATLTFSLIASVIILPAQLAAAPFRPKPRPWLIVWLEAGYRRSLNWVLHHSYWSIGAFIAALVLTLGVVFPLVGFELFPASDNNVMLVRIETPRGTALSETAERVAAVEQAIVATISPKDLASYVTTVGDKVAEADDIFGVRQAHWAKVAVNLAPREQRKVSVFAYRERLTKALAPLQGEKFTRLETLVSEGGPPVGKQIDVSFIGNNDQARRQLADELEAYLRAQPGVIGLTRDDELGENELEVRLNSGLMADLGITALDVARTIRAAVDGEIVTAIRLDGEEIDFRVAAVNRAKNDTAFLGNLTIPNRQGKLIPLREIIRFEKGTSLLAIKHQGGDRSVRLRASVERGKGDAGKINREIRARFEPRAAAFGDLRVKFGGLEESTFEALRNFANAFIIAILVIYILLVMLFGSLTQPFVVMLAIPFGLIGVILGFALHLTPVTFLGLIGLLGLAGVVVDNALVMLSFLNENERQHCCRGTRLEIEKILEVSVTRLRPIFLTTATTAAGLLPAVYGWFGSPVPELYPLLLSTAYGLIFSTVITLYLIPTIYLLERQFGCWYYARFKKQVCAADIKA